MYRRKKASIIRKKKESGKKSPTRKCRNTLPPTFSPALKYLKEYLKGFRATFKLLLSAQFLKYISKNGSLIHFKGRNQEMCPTNSKMIWMDFWMTGIQRKRNRNTNFFSVISHHARPVEKMRENLLSFLW